MGTNPPRPRQRATTVPPGPQRRRFRCSCGIPIDVRRRRRTPVTGLRAAAGRSVSRRRGAGRGALRRGGGVRPPRTVRSHGAGRGAGRLGHAGGRRHARRLLAWPRVKNAGARSAGTTGAQGRNGSRHFTESFSRSMTRGSRREARIERLPRVRPLASCSATLAPSAFSWRPDHSVRAWPTRCAPGGLRPSLLWPVGQSQGVIRRCRHRRPLPTRLRAGPRCSRCDRATSHGAEKGPVARS